MLLVPWIGFHALVIVNIPKNHLAEAVEIGQVTHLRIEELRHQRTSGALIVNLGNPVSCRSGNKIYPFRIRSTPQFLLT